MEIEILRTSTLPKQIERKAAASQYVKTKGAKRKYGDENEGQKINSLQDVPPP